MTHALLLIAAAFVATSQTADDALVGNWRGDSICAVHNSTCADEKALYHVKKLGQPDHYSLQGDKIVNGEPINMGTVDCVFMSEKAMLSCELPKSVIHLTLRGTRLEGTMNLPDGTLWRNISLEKDSAR